MPNLPNIGSEVQKMAKKVKLPMKVSYFRIVREKNNFSFSVERNPQYSNLGKFEMFSKIENVRA